jgi:hypothetical protein
MHPIHSIGPKTQDLGYLGSVGYCMKIGAKWAQLMLLTHKFAKQSCVGIFRNEDTRSTPLGSKLMFWCILNHFITARKSVQNGPN